ncbi:VCBS repeat domain-containing M23 family metallopeptidase [Microbacterium sp. p3-SID336]|uniref:VCBS repeat domain-containing M23 family metallopeptidase n=1 Tax=Microbacterium sp. p3-SID336 TaxID=2916212 RepID=UPI0021A753B9|nr:VCBS repeat domain-containing M23 family metallopeptidase [Microbacterium sp. p3-SID336]MCT1478636.1 VCBS repeat domain-containing M23 family metallopeptidase [Microbacterium sp. p3-SID336]
MKRTSRLRRGRIGIVVVLAMMLGTLAPALTAGDPAVAAAPDGYMVYPSSGNIQSKVGDGCRGNYRAHDGIDISGNGGTPILAAYDGVVRTRTYNGGYGNYTDIEHPGGYVTRYAHMAGTPWYAPGTKVLRGQQIGVVGNTGNSAAYHLHFEVWLNGRVWSGINDGFTCLSNVTRGGTIPLFIPGLGTGAGMVASADYTGDGNADVLVVAGNGDLRIRTGNGQGVFAPATTALGLWGGTRRHVTHGDFNGDNKADVLAARVDGTLEFFAGNGAGGFAVGKAIGNGWYGLLHVVSGADFTGDGKQDVIGVSASGVMTLYEGNGSGGFTGRTTLIGSGWQGFQYIVAGDFDNDGRGDLMAASDTGSLYFYRGVNNGFQNARLVGEGWLEFTGMSGGVDYNGDRRADLVGRTAAGQLYLYTGLGDGTFGAKNLVGSDWSSYLTFE